jgi:beta-phosphoglucomutase-like phosphatase (HAD superfamily)
MKNILDIYDLFIFDLDDTIVKTENYHYEAWLNIIRNNIDTNFYFDYSVYCSIFHSNKIDNIKKYLKNDLLVEDVESIIKEKNKYYINLINTNKDKLKLIDGVLELLTTIINNNKKFIIVSNSTEQNVIFFCDLFPILNKCSKKYYGEILNYKKPDPMSYIQVIEEFYGSKIIGFEDSITGIHAMANVKDIDTIFINNKDYFHYDYIIKNYNIKLTIENYNIFI